tara:strand:+ start:92 stop:427 length:336 start_codon:yes stop_codon:yes gene_type:complete
MDKRYPLAYLLETFCGLDSNTKNLNRWKALLRKSSVPIILDSGHWLIKEKDFNNFLKEREHCFKYEKEKVVHITRSLVQSKHQTATSGSDSLQKLLTSKMQKAKHLKSQSK